MITRRIRKRGIIIVGFLIISIAMLLIGGSEDIDQQLPQSYGRGILIVFCLCLLGLSGGMVTIPVLPEMLESFEEDQEMSQKYSRT
jgi:hypothetical protein